MKSSCIFYAVEEFSTKGGRMVIEMSRRGPLMHMYHSDDDGTLTAFEPSKGILRHWLMALLPYEGYVRKELARKVDRTPTDIQLMLAGFILAFSILGWYCNKKYKSTKEWVKKKINLNNNKES